MVRAVEIAVAQLAPTTETLWVSAFDTLWDGEVPPEARRRIFEILATTPAKTIITECHPNSVRPAAVAECVKQLEGHVFGLELGVETMDEFTRYASVNKPFSNELLERSVRCIRELGALPWANLIVGLPFLDTQEVVEGAAWSIGEALRLGFGRVVLFPNHVKEYTVAHLLAAANRYSPPDLWVMRDVIARVPADTMHNIYFAWLDPRPHPGAPRVVYEPDASSTVDLRHALECFNRSRDYVAIQKALALPWSRPRTTDKRLPLVDRLLSQYRWLSEDHGEAGWWARHGEEVRAEVELGYSSSYMASLT
jgi:uncharacterized Fe-S cluster-containing MiaB family protein